MTRKLLITAAILMWPRKPSIRDDQLEAILPVAGTLAALVILLLIIAV